MPDHEPAELSRLLWDAREGLEMYADHLDARGVPSRGPRQTVAEIDAYRARQGWNPHGFGGEAPDWSVVDG